MIRHLILLLSLVASLTAQRIQVTNFAEHPYEGWWRATVDTLPEHLHGITADGVEYHVGRQVGLESWVVDFRTTLPQRRPITIDLTKASKTEFQPFDSGIEDIGAPMVGGSALGLAPTSVGGRENPLQDGAGYVVHWQGRPFPDSPMWHADVWVTYYPDQPWAVGEVVLTASNPATPEIRANVPDGGIFLGWTNALCLVDSVALGQPLLRSGDWAADGQARSFRFVLGYLSGLQTDDVRYALAVSDHAIVANGLERPGPFGVAEVGPDYDARPWVINHWDGVRQRLLGWDAGSVGVAANSGQTGAQEDQGFAKGARAYAKGGRGAEVVRYYAALGQSRRPCHHLEADGSLLDLESHPDLVFWSGRPHWHTGVSKDRLGKEESLQTGWRSHGWNGPDREHWFINTLAFSAELTASPALQWQLEHHVRIWHFQETIGPRLSTSRPDAARSQGWAGIVAAHLWHTLEDRSLAQRVKDRFQARARQVYLPHYQGNQWQLWDVQQDPRVTQYVDQQFYPYVTMAYQVGLATMGIEIAAQVFEMPVLADEAYKQAVKIVEAAYDPVSLREWEIIGIRPDGTLADQPIIEGVSGHRTGWYGGAWLPCAAWVVLQHDPDHELARRVYEKATAGDAPNPWMPPLR